MTHPMAAPNMGPTMAEPSVRPGLTEAPVNGAAARWIPTNVNEMAVNTEPWYCWLS